MTRMLVPSIALLSACSSNVGAPDGRDLLAQAAVEAGGTTILLEICGNGVDDDGDGLRDREDPDCADEIATYTSRLGERLGFYGEGLEGHDWWPEWPEGSAFKAEIEIDGETALLVHHLDAKAQNGRMELYFGEEEEAQSIIDWDTRGMPVYVEVVRSFDSEREGLLFALDDGTYHLVPGPIEGEYLAQQLSEKHHDERW